MDRTDSLLDELVLMIHNQEIVNQITADKIKEIIEQVKKDDINIIELRKASSVEKFGKDTVEVVAEANRRIVR